MMDHMVSDEGQARAESDARPIRERQVDLAHLSGVTRVTVRKWLGKDGGMA